MTQLDKCVSVCIAAMEMEKKSPFVDFKLIIFMTHDMHYKVLVQYVQESDHFSSRLKYKMNKSYIDSL